MVAQHHQPGSGLRCPDIHRPDPRRGPGEDAYRITYIILGVPHNYGILDLKILFLIVAVILWVLEFRVQGSL